MCTYNISVNDELMERVRPAFKSNEDIGAWMQTQIELLLLKLVSNSDNKRQEHQPLSKRLRGIVHHAPKDFDYKVELSNRF